MCVAAALAGAALAGCALDPVVIPVGHVIGNWRIERQHDRITGAPVSGAWLDTRTASNFSQFFAMGSRLNIGCFRQREPHIVFEYEFKIGADANAMLTYRFDDRPAREPKVKFHARAQTVVIQEPAEAARFLDELAASKILYVMIRSDTVGRSAAEFELDGAREAVELAMAGCHKLRPHLAMTASDAQKP